MVIAAGGGGFYVVVVEKEIEKEVGLVGWRWLLGKTVGGGGGAAFAD